MIFADISCAAWARKASLNPASPPAVLIRFIENFALFFGFCLVEVATITGLHRRIVGKRPLVEKIKVIIA